VECPKEWQYYDIYFLQEEIFVVANAESVWEFQCKAFQEVFDYWQNYFINGSGAAWDLLILGEFCLA
jgi:hypothetical protein